MAMASPAKILELFEIDAPIIQAPMAGVATPEMAAAVSNAGGLGSLGVGATNAVGLYIGYASPLFAMGVVVAMIVTYDAAGVRRQAGMHAERINVLFDELLQGHMWDEEELREVLGHTPLEVLAGIIWGLLVTTLVWLNWK